jgi:hypothetical protein
LEKTNGSALWMQVIVGMFFKVRSLSVNHMWRMWRIIFFISLFAPSLCMAHVSFSRLYGSDLGMGIGAKAIGMGGAFVAIADDASATFWNPAGLAGLSYSQMYMSAETPGDFSAASLIYKPPLDFLEAMNFAVGVSYIKRLRFKGDSGEGDWSGYPSNLLNLAMVNTDQDFSGTVDSKTCDTRISLAFSPPGIKKLSIGANYIFLK